MVAASKIVELLPEGYGYVIFVAVDSIFLNMWLAHNVGSARKKFGIEYPKVYDEKNNHNNEFNCVQRAHQNWLENYPQFFALLFIGGLEHPKITASAGLLYLIGRVVYAKGYYTGEPKNRLRGIFAFPALFVMLGTTICTALRQLKWQPAGQKWFC